MKLKSRIIGSSMVAVLALGMSAAPTFATTSPVDPPVAATGQTVYPQGTQVSYGGCTGMLIGTLKSVELDSLGKPMGLGTTNRNISSSSKGVPSTPEQAANMVNGIPTPIVGSCIVDGRIGVTNLAGGAIGSKTVLKSSTKLSSPATSCNSDFNGNGIPREPAAFVTKQVPTGLSQANGGSIVTTTASVGGDFQSTTRALSGKFSYTFSDATKSDAYIRVQGFDGELATVIWLTGIVTKGEFVGSTVGGNVWFNPVAKNKLATTYYAARTLSTGPSNLDLLADAYIADPANAGLVSLGAFYGSIFTYSVAPGYMGGGALFDGPAAGALGCLTGDVMIPGIQTIAIGAGNREHLKNATTEGIRFLL